MLTLLIAVVIGTVFAIFATQNTGTVILNFGKYSLSAVPIYLAILAPLIVFIFLAFIIYLIRNLSGSLTVSEQKSNIKKLKSELAEVTKEAHKLQLENIRLKKDNGEPVDGNSI